jgi:hypothetical protein
MRLFAFPLAFALITSVTQIAGCGNDDSNPTIQSNSTAEKSDRPMTEAELREEKSRRVFNPTPEERAEDEAKAKAETDKREAEARANEPVVTQLEEPGAAPAFTEYKNIEMGTQLMFLQSALSKQPLNSLDIVKGFNRRIGDYDLGDAEMSKLLGELVNEGDQFVQRDIAKKLDPILQKHAEEYKSVRYVKVVVTTSGALSAYDFDKQGFDFTPDMFNDEYKGSEEDRVKALRTGAPVIDRGTVFFSDNSQHHIVFSNGAEFRFIKVTDEATARTIEASLKNPGTDAIIYGYVESVQDGKKTKSDNYKHSVIKIQRVDLAEENGQPFYSYTN